MRLLLIALGTLPLLACTMSGDFEADAEAYRCTSEALNHSFAYNVDTVRNVRVGIGAGSSMTITTHSGEVMQATQAISDAYICLPTEKKED